MKRPLLLHVVVTAVLCVSASALARKTAPKPEPQPTAAPAPPDKAATCYALGRSYGYAYWALNDPWRAKTELFERYCTDRPQGPVPSDADVKKLMEDLTLFSKTLDDRPYVDYRQLEKDIQPMQQQEGALIDGMLKR